MFVVWILEGWAAVDAGDAVAGAALIEGGVHDWQATGARLMLPYFEALLADVLPDSQSSETVGTIRALPMRD